MTEQKKDVIHVVISSLTEPPYAERHVRWCERGGLNHPYSILEKIKKIDLFELTYSLTYLVLKK